MNNPFGISDEYLEEIDKTLRQFADAFGESLQGLLRDLNEQFTRVEPQFLLPKKMYRQHTHAIHMHRRALLIRGKRKRKERRIVHSRRHAKGSA